VGKREKVQSRAGRWRGERVRVRETRVRQNRRRSEREYRVSVAVEVAAGVCQCANDGCLVTGRINWEGNRVRLNAGSVGSLGGGEDKTRETTPPLPKGLGSTGYRDNLQSTVDIEEN
jgi:hypothetical protein